MKINHAIISINARDFAAQTQWWTKLIGRSQDQEPMPSCHEWNLTDDILFQVLDSNDHHGSATVTLHVPDLDAEINRLDKAGIDVPEPVRIDGIETLRFAQFTDAEGNTVDLLDGR